MNGHANAIATWAVVPAKCFARAKSRLAPAMSARRRTEVARGFLEHVLEVTLGAPSIAGVLVATECDDVAAMARAQGAEVVHDGAKTPFGRPGARAGGLATIVDAALARLAAADVVRAVVLMSDLPLLARDDVDALVRLLDEAPRVIAPDVRKEGTNALGVHLHDGGRAPVATCFGTVGSFALHAQAARAAGLAPAIYTSARVGLDIDTPADLVRLRAVSGVNLRAAAASSVRRGARSSSRPLPSSA